MLEGAYTILPLT